MSDLSIGLREGGVGVHFIALGSVLLSFPFALVLFLNPRLIYALFSCFALPLSSRRRPNHLSCLSCLFSLAFGSSSSVLSRLHEKHRDNGHVAPAMPGVHHHHVPPHLPAVHHAHPAGAGPVLLPALRHPVDGDAATGHADSEGGTARRDREASNGCVRDAGR